MSARLLATLVLCAAPPGEIVVRDGETLPQLAKRVLGDEHAASELKAINNLPSDFLASGMTIKLPGPDRTLALTALSAAKSAVEQAAPNAKDRAEATAKIREAELLLQSARYAEAAKTADAAWQLVSSAASLPTRFSVQVADNGRTTVNAQSGQPVHVEAQGVTRALYAGQETAVDKGSPPRSDEPVAEPAPEPVLAPIPLQPVIRPAPPPAAPRPALQSPAAVAPADGAALRLKSNPNGVGPVSLSWTPVAGATAYEVEAIQVGGEAKRVVMTFTRPEGQVPSVNPGRYRWFVRAVRGSAERSPPSPERTFEAYPESLRLDVKANTWK